MEKQKTSVTPAAVYAPTPVPVEKFVDGLRTLSEGIITKQAIRRGAFTSVNPLIHRIRDYIERWNTDAAPFTWTATADEILAKVRWVQTSVKQLVDNNAK